MVGQGAEQLPLPVPIPVSGHRATAQAIGSAVSKRLAESDYSRGISLGSGEATVARSEGAPGVLPSSGRAATVEGAPQLGESGAQAVLLNAGKHRLQLRLLARRQGAGGSGGAAGPGSG